MVGLGRSAIHGGDESVRPPGRLREFIGRHFTCMPLVPPSLAAPRRPPRVGLQTLEDKVAEVSKPCEEQPPDEPVETLPVPLEVGFARLELRKVDAFPGNEVRIIAQEHSWTPEGLLAMFDFIAAVLELRAAACGFVLTYDFKDLGMPQVELISDILQWAHEPARKDRWQRQCICWKIVVPEGMTFPFQMMLQGLFFIYPPSCGAYLVSDPDGACSERALCYRPPEEEAPPGDAGGTGPPAPHGRREDGDDPARRTASSGSAATLVAALPDALDVGFARICQGYDEDAGEGYLRIFGSDQELTDSGLAQMMDFMDAFVGSPSAQDGFSITYDLRALRTPSMSMVMHVAEWGGQAERKETWERLNHACKVVVNDGFRYSLCKAVLSTFFYVCPPIVPTYLLTDPDADDAGVVFRPAEAPSAAAAAGAAGPAPADADAVADDQKVVEAGAPVQEKTAKELAAGERQEEEEDSNLWSYFFGGFH